MSAHPKTALPVLAAAMSEDELLSAVISLAGEFGWMAFHPRPGQTRRGQWLTFVAGQSGFPDVVAARRGRIMFIELKSEKGRLSEAQKEWGKHLQAPWRNAAHEYHVWRPSDWLDGRIEKALR